MQGAVSGAEPQSGARAQRAVHVPLRESRRADGRVPAREQRRDRRAERAPCAVGVARVHAGRTQLEEEVAAATSTSIGLPVMSAKGEYESAQLVIVADAYAIVSAVEAWHHRRIFCTVPKAWMRSDLCTEFL